MATFATLSNNLQQLSCLSTPTSIIAATAAMILLIVIAFSTGSAKKNFSYFKKYKSLSIKDSLIVDMLESYEGKASWVLTDPDLPDNPIVHSSDAFCQLTGYEKHEIEGRNCRFLQGRDTDPDSVEVIREAVRQRRDQSVCLLNYTKGGKPFLNQFFLTPLFTEDDHVAFFLGVQLQVLDKLAENESRNPGWQIFKWL